jgi:tRNA A37 threonylcarbamoyladenosine dehydratase
MTENNPGGKPPAWLGQLLKQGDSLYHPIFFRLANKEDSTMYSQLREYVPHVLVNDHIRDQLAGLIKTRTPQRKYTYSELEQEVQAWLGGTPPEQYGVWVYYPWSQRLVHLLDQTEFIELRTARNVYKIAPDELEHLSRKRIGIIGLSVGQSIALTIATERSFGEIRLADFDTLELSNLNRIRSGVHNLGIVKAVLTARDIAEIDPFLHIRCFPEGIHENNLDQFLLEGGKLDILVDECDGLDIKVLARLRARALRIPVVMDTSDRGLIDVERFDIEPDRPLLHGMIGDPQPDQLKDLSTEGKIDFMFSLLGLETLSRRAKASMIEIEQSIETWPQLASSVVLGGAIAADVCRRIALGHYHESGRYFVDLEELVGDKQRVEQAELPGYTLPFGTGALEPLTYEQMRTLIEQVSPIQAAECVQPRQQEVLELIEAAILAPSIGNSQPWHWVYHDGTLFLFHNISRSASLLDYDPDAPLVVLGAACENLVLQAHTMGMEVHIRNFPLGENTPLVAAFDFLLQEANWPVELHIYDELARVIPARHTNRKVGVRKPLPQNALTQMRQAAESTPGAAFHSLEGSRELLEIGQIIGAADRLRLLHQQSHQEMMSEIRWTYEEEERSRDGLGIETLELSSVNRALFQIFRDWSVLNLIQQWGGGRNLEKVAKNAVNAASCVALITMPSHHPIDYLNGGRAMQRAWLMANSLQVAWQPLMAPVYMFAGLTRVDFPDKMASELHELQARYRKLFAVKDHMSEILLFRLSIANPPSARSLRRPAADVLSFYS